jgi:hypothetical protein
MLEPKEERDLRDGRVVDAVLPESILAPGVAVIGAH